MEKKIVVPEGMRVAVAKAVFDEVGHVNYHPQIRIALDAAVRWLHENPTIPTDETMQECSDIACKKYYGSTEQRAEYIRQVLGRMFLAPEPEIGPGASNILRMAQGCTFTPEEYKAIEFSVRTATHGLIPDRAPDLEVDRIDYYRELPSGEYVPWGEPQPLKCNVAPEPEVPEEIKDLLVSPTSKCWRGDEYNAALLEAFRRGERSKEAQIAQSVSRVQQRS